MPPAATPQHGPPYALHLHRAAHFMELWCSASFQLKKLNENKVSSECQTWKASSMWMVGHVCDRGTSTCGQTEQAASRHGQGEQRLRPGTGQAHGVSDQQYTHSSACPSRGTVDKASSQCVTTGSSLPFPQPPASSRKR